MSELRLSPEDMAEIDRRFWEAVETERRIYRAQNKAPATPSPLPPLCGKEPRKASGTKCYYHGDFPL